MNSQRETDFIEFATRMFGAVPTNGPQLRHTWEIFDALYPSELDKIETVRVPQEFTDEIYDTPNICYVIRQKDTGRCYVGRAKHGFITRYKDGEWWKHTHSNRLARDVELYGINSFYVNIYVCQDEQDMERTEARLITANRLYTYNIRPEPDNPITKLD